ncbi:G-rich sequence factor 1 isoform X2 [Betta splendens]|uniref:G-rich sequence factor 1 isoform X2 n=1 Tax=Betta splendens TaxID=158456 RepID=A0A6P7LG30_BETSP|nr:G-rich sequence factor 1 isoform X2 [Betta splendens]
MSSNSKYLLFWLRRCVAVKQLMVPSGIRALGGCGFVQQRTWSSATRTVCPQRVGRIRASVTASLCTKTGTTCESKYPPLPDYGSDTAPQKEDVYIVQVKGFPWSCSAQDLLQFFSECRIRNGVNGIHLTVDRLGRPSGHAFIELEHEEDVGKALEKHRHYLGPRYVEVKEVRNSDAEAILKRSVQAPSGSGVVRLRGLPFTCTEDDVAHFFSGLDIVENGVTIVTDHRGRRSGDAFVQFSSQRAADEALQRDRQVMGNRYIEVFPSRSDEIHSSRRRTGPAAGGTGSPQSSSLPLHYVHVRGLPFRVSADDIVAFFSPLIVAKILLECAPDGRPNGEADVFFSRHQDAVAAMSRDREYIGNRYVELFLNSARNCDGR